MALEDYGTWHTNTIALHPVETIQLGIIFMKNLFDSFDIGTIMD